ncbi:hypothetical protein AAY72_04350 [Alishewanella sp. WH16-1]|uniref:BatD family protein n=1 Tax=Alishewanella sp. WH16-1 TaxID=1651088 RepID=UPI00070B8AC5|nr:BatD family protein [Alishewanella sp. WH16-1]KRS22235.1 hypothetical protein AAY72_04350 [Alishewanella sp. WH16-1]
MVTRLLVVILFSQLLFGGAAMAFSSLQSSVDKNPAMLGEAITLVVTADARLSADALDYRELQQDFRVMVPAVSQSTQVINGRTSHSTSWSLTLFPRSTGSFRIPAFTINGISSTPIALEVIEQAQSQTKQDIFLEAKLSGYPSVYVQQMLYYDVVIYFSGDLQRGNLTEPALEGAEIQRLGPDVEGTALVDGVRYRTITRRYAITPQQSGNLSIQPPLFTGDMIDRDPSRYNYFSRSKTVMAEAEPVRLEIKPQPDNFPGNWLVAGLVTLTEEWQPEGAELKAGEPVTRIITLSAVDVAANQLPDLSQQYPDGIRAYQEQPQSRGAERSGRMVAQKVYTTALIASSNGSLVLPEIRLPWWNSQTNQLDYAVLPERTLQVSGQAQQPISPAPVIQTKVQTQTPTANHWQWNYTSNLLAGLWLSSLLLVGYLLQRRASIARTAPTSQPDASYSPKALQRACQTGDAKAAAQALLYWGKQRFQPAPRSLGELRRHAGTPAFADALLQLEQQLYGQQNTPWQGDMLYQAWQQLPKATATSKRSALTALYPE